MYTTVLMDGVTEGPNVDSLPKNSTPNLLFYGKGTNGSGKSAIPYVLLASDPDAFYIKYGKKIIATVFPNHGMAAIAKYKLGKNCGGADMLYKPNIVVGLELLFQLDYDIFFEGSIVGSSRWAYYNWFKELVNTGIPIKPVILQFRLPVEKCYERVAARSGKSMEVVSQMACIGEKHRIYDRHILGYQELGEFPVHIFDTEKLSIEEVYSEFCELRKNLK